jgi:hypothetical protein
MKNMRLRSRFETGNTLAKVLFFLLAIASAFTLGFVSAEEKNAAYDFIRGRMVERANFERRASANEMWAKRLVQGGYVLHFRHAQREKWNDVTAFDAYELSQKIDASKASFYKAVCLTPQGEEEAKLVGELFKMTGVKTGSVISSPSCRAKQTSMLAFGRIDGIENSLMHRTALILSQHESSAKRLRKVIEGLNPPKGQNIALIGHINTLSYDGPLVIDVDHTDGIDDRDETGFVVIEKKDGKLIAQHRFRSIYEFAHAIVKLPVD